MMQHKIWNILIVTISIILMEIIATLIHKYIMHEYGWKWHISHHEIKNNKKLEKNDLYAIIFTIISIILMHLGFNKHWPLQWFGIGMTIYGILYFIVHDGLVHKRWPFLYTPKKGYLKHLYVAHRIHHIIREKKGSVSFGFLYAPNIIKLKRKLQKN